MLFSVEFIFLEATEGCYRCFWHQIPPNTSRARAGTRYRQNYPTVRGPFLKESNTQEPRDWMRDTEQKRVISFRFSRQDLNETWTARTESVKTVSRAPEAGGKLGTKRVDEFSGSWQSLQMSVLRIVVLPGRLPQATTVASGFSMSRNPKPTKKAEALLLKKELTSDTISVTKLEWVRITSSHGEMGITFS